MIQKVRPQVLVSILLLGVLAWVAIEEDMVEIATGCVTLIGALSMKIIDSD